MKVCLVNDTSDDINWGGKATSQALRDLVAVSGSTIVSTLYQYEISTPQASDYPIAWRDGSAKELDDLAPACWEDFESCVTRVLDGEWFPSIYRALSDCDAVLINGEGCIYDCTRQSRMIYFIAYLAKRYLGKRTAIVNHSIVMNDPLLVEIAVNVYPYLDDIVFREPDSAAACPGVSGRVGADAAYRLVPNLVSCWDVAGVDSFDPFQPYVAVGGGSVFFRGLRPDHDPIPGYMRLCERLMEMIGQVVLTASSHKDQCIMVPVARELGLKLIDTRTPIRQAVDVLGHASAYVGARWHPSIFAHSGGTPVIALTRHTPKMEAFLKQADMPMAMFDPFLLEEQYEDIVAVVIKSLSAGEPFRESLRASAMLLAERTLDNVKVLV